MSDGKKGNEETIKFMKKVARDRAGHPLIRRLATSILTYNNIPSQYYVDEALAIGDYVKKMVRYVRDPDGIEYLQDPIDLVKQIEMGQASGDCDDMSLLIATLLLSVGHVPSFRAVRYKDYSGHYNHIYVVDYEKNWGGERQRVVLDAIMKDQPIGFEVPHQSGDEYSV